MIRDYLHAVADRGPGASVLCGLMSRTSWPWLLAGVSAVVLLLAAGSAWWFRKRRVAPARRTRARVRSGRS